MPPRSNASQAQRLDEAALAVLSGIEVLERRARQLRRGNRDEIVNALHRAAWHAQAALRAMEADNA